jgi:hypothetical protein
LHRKARPGRASRFSPRTRAPIHFHICIPVDTDNGWHVPVKARAASAWRAAQRMRTRAMQARAWHQTALTAAAGRHGRGRRLPRLPASPTRAQAAIRVAPKRIDSARAPSRTAALPVVRGEPARLGRARVGASASASCSVPSRSGRHGAQRHMPPCLAASGRARELAEAGNRAITYIVHMSARRPENQKPVKAA